VERAIRRPSAETAFKVAYDARASTRERPRALTNRNVVVAARSGSWLTMTHPPRTSASWTSSPGNRAVTDREPSWIRCERRS
jgi:hypothetical protein